MDQVASFGQGVGMLKLESYNNKHLQHLMQLLNQCENEGVTDIRFIREQLHKHLYRPQKLRRPMHKITPEHLCPECKSPMYPAKGHTADTFVVVDGKQILVCGKCRYSEVSK